MEISRNAIALCDATVNPGLAEVHDIGLLKSVTILLIWKFTV